LNDLFLTTSKDSTSRLWNLHKRECVCILQDSNFAVFDSTGNVIASTTTEFDKTSDKKTSNYINLYDVEKINEGPFKVFKIDSPEIKHLKFSNNGAYLLATTSEFILIIDSFTGDLLGRLFGDISEGDVAFKADFSPDSKYVVSGTESGKILIWNVEKKNLSINPEKKNNVLATLDAHPQTANCVKFSPKHILLATACTNLLLWTIPELVSMNIDS
jgi:COMPASS component SWD2